MCFAHVVMRCFSLLSFELLISSLELKLTQFQSKIVGVMQSEGGKDCIIGKDDAKEVHKFSVVNNFNSEVTVSSSVPQTFIVSTDNNVVTLISSLGNDQNAFHLNTITDDQQLPSSQVITLKQLQNLQQSEIHDENVVKEADYQPLVNEVILQPEHSEHDKISENPLSQLEVSESDTCDEMTVKSHPVLYKEDITSMVLNENEVVNTSPYDSLSIQGALHKGSEKYFFLETMEEVEEAIRKHTEETFSHFVVAKKTKAYGSTVSAIDTSSKFRIHWQSRDLTSTEECAVQIPFQGVPFIYIGEKAYMCHLGRNKLKGKPALQPDIEVEMLNIKRHRSRLTKKQGCPAKIFVKQIAKFPDYRIPCNSEYLRTQMSQKLRKAILDSNGHINHVIQYIGTLPHISEHSNHDIGVNTPVKEPIDPLIRDKIVELLWKFGESTMPKEIKDMLDHFVCEIFQGRDLPSKHRRRFYPSEKDIANYIYKSRLLSKISCSEQEQMHQLLASLQSEYPNDHFLLQIEIDNHFAIPVDFAEGNRLVKDMKNNMSPMNEQKFLFVFQSSHQQRLLKLYGKQIILTEISKQFAHMPFPCYGLFVPTNVDYQMVHCFIVQSRTLDYLRKGLTPLLEWNSSWNPKFFTVDFSSEQINIIEEMFPACSVLISDLSREECWKKWFEIADNSASLQGNKERVFDLLSAFANSYTEETLNVAAQNLENSEEWRLSESLRDWFSSDWLAEVKRWVAGYRHDELMGTLHIEGKLAGEVSNLRDSHTTHLRNKKMVDFISYIVKLFAPQCHQRYVEKNVSDYRTQYFRRNTTQNYIPSYLEDKTDSVTTYVLQQLEAIKTQEYTVNQVQAGIFWILDKADPDTTYTVTLGDDSSLPSCICTDWLKYKLPCKHMVCVLEKVHELGWNMVSTLYSSNPILTLDFGCIDKEHEDKFLSNWKKDDCVESGIEPAHVQVLDSKEKTSSNRAMTITYPIPVKSPSNFLNPIPSNAEPDTVTTDNVDMVSSLASECDVICEQLTNSIHHMRDQNVLQKVKLDLEMILNTVKLELVKTTPKSSKRVATSNDDACPKKSKCDETVTANDSVSLTNVHVSGTNCNADYVQLMSFSNQSKSYPAKCDLSPRIIANTNFSPKLTVPESSETNDVWIYDPELDIKLFKADRVNILCGETLSIEIIKTVQNILKHQFSDVDGLRDPLKLASNHSVVEDFSSKKKVLQLHLVDDHHWSASARTSQHVGIFCCTLSSKAAVIEQVLKMTPNNTFRDNIFFIERVEEESAVKNCSLYAIAYSVAFLFDIEARNFVFAENEMRSHLAECLEDMCFSMFPVKPL